MPLHTPRKSSGFSLIEASIVLGVIGMALGSIWVVTSSVRQSAKATSLQQQINLTVQNIRTYYAGRALPTGAAGEITASTFTDTLRDRSVFPEDMCNAACVAGGDPVNVYGGAVLVNIVNTSPFTTFNLNLDGVDKRGCIQAMMNLTARSAELGLTSIEANGGTARTSFPVGVSTAESDCSSEADNELDLIFNIRV